MSKSELSSIADKSRKQNLSKEEMNTPEALEGFKGILSRSMVDLNSFSGGLFRASIILGVALCGQILGTIFLKQIGEMSSDFTPTMIGTGEISVLGIVIAGVILIISIYVGILIGRTITKILAASRIKKLRASSALSNPEEFILCLSQYRKEGILDIRLQFSSEWNEVEQNDLKAALKTVFPYQHLLNWKDSSKLSVQIKKLRAKRIPLLFHKGNALSNNDSYRSYQFFNKNVVSLLNEVHEIEKFSVHITGDVYHPDSY